MDEQTFSDYLFFGEYDHSVDSQCRVALPSDWRKEGPDRFVLIPGRGKALILLPAADFTGMLHKARAQAVANPAIQLAFARIGAAARQCRPDKQGRISIERPMLDGIGVKDTLKMVGALSHIRLSAPENWPPPGEGESFDSSLDELDKLASTGADGLAALLSQIGGGK